MLLRERMPLSTVTLAGSISKTPASSLTAMFQGLVCTVRPRVWRQMMYVSEMEAVQTSHYLHTVGVRVTSENAHSPPKFV